MKRVESVAGEPKIIQRLAVLLRQGLSNLVRGSANLDTYFDILKKHQVSPEGADALGWKINRNLRGKRYE